MRWMLWCLIMLTATGLGWWSGDAPSEPRSKVDTVSVERPSLLGKRAHLAGATQLAKACLRVPIEHLPDRLEKALSRSSSGVSFEVQMLLARWHQSDRDAALEWAMNKDTSVLRLLASWWLEEDAEGAWVASNVHRWYVILFGELAKSNPAQFFKRAQSFDSRNAHDHQIHAAAASLAKKDLEAALSLLKDSETWPEHHQAQMVAAIAAEQAQQLSLEDALAWAAQLEPHADGALAVVIDHLANTDLETAMQTLQEYGLRGGGSTTNLGKALDRLPSEERLALLKRYPIQSASSIKEDLPKDPASARDLLVSVEADAQAARQALSMWQPISDDVLATLDMFDGSPTESVDGAMLGQCLQAWGQDHADTLIPWITEEPDAKRRTEYAAHACNGCDWATFARYLELVDLEEVPIHLSYIIRHRLTTTIQQQAGGNPIKAIELANALPDSLRLRAYHEIAKVWVRGDEAATREWLLTVPAGAEREAVTKHISELELP